MIKTLVILVVGIAIGVGGTLTFQNPRGMANKAHSAVNSAESKVEAHSREQCVKDFLTRTHCLNDAKLTQEECDALILKECGDDFTR